MGYNYNEGSTGKEYKAEFNDVPENITEDTYNEHFKSSGNKILKLIIYAKFCK